MANFTEGNSDDVAKAVSGLDIFTKNWCMNCQETNQHKEPIFRCSECEFQCENGECLIKVFADKHQHNYPMNNFESMRR